MSTAPPSGGPPPPSPYAGMQQSEEFGELRRAYRSFVLPLTIGFIAWYLLYVLLSNYAAGFMGTEVTGNINVAFVLGVAQFLSTFVIAWWYARHARTKLDPKAYELKRRIESETGTSEESAR